MIFFSRHSKYYVSFENAIKIEENLDRFEKNSVWTCCRSFCYLWQEYMWLVVNLLKSGPKIRGLTKRHDTQINFFDINGTLS